ncbi:MAG: hypothetical protein CML30_07260 [Rhizobiales bacterium]|nr:hypothetical protein [Hyphomicrobiales bacterium]
MRNDITYSDWIADQEPAWLAGARYFVLHHIQNERSPHPAEGASATACPSQCEAPSGASPKGDSARTKP